MITVETEEIGDVRAVAADFFARHAVTLDDDDAPRYDRSVWARACTELGVSAIGEPEDDGGIGGGAAMLATVLVEAARTLSPLPILSSAVRAQTALRMIASAQARAELLEPLMAGEQVATLAPIETSMRAVTAHDGGDGNWTVDGTVARVLDGDTADVVLLVAAVGEGIGLFAVRDGFERRRQTALDVTRSFATLDLAGTPAQLLGTAAPSAIAAIEQWSTLAVVADQVGGAQTCLDTTVDYLKTRIQYGRVLGSFQSLKHQCAELVLRVDEARSALAYLAWALDESPADAAEAAAMAAVAGATAYTTCADEAVHLHGGIGFTWEHDAHRHVRRALTDRSVFGSVRAAREAVLAARGL